MSEAPTPTPTAAYHTNNNRSTMTATVSPMASSSIRRGPCHEESSYRGQVGVGFHCDNFLHADDHAIIDGDGRMATMPSSCSHTTAAVNIDGHIRSRYRRRRAAAAPSVASSYSWSSTTFKTVVVTAAAVIASTSITSSEAFSPSPMQRLSPPQYSSSSSLLHAVHKRSGNHDLSSPRATAASIAATKNNKVTATKRKTTPSTVAAASATATAPTRTEAPPPRRRKSNVFEQFTPEYMSSPFDVDLSPADITNGHVSDDSINKKKNGAASLKKKNGAAAATIEEINDHKINLRLQTLLRDDTGEQENEMYPDHSPEAAQQLADLKSYSKLSEEARRKANLAVKFDNDDGEEDVASRDGDGDGGATKRMKRGVTVTRRRRGGLAGEEEEEAATSNAVTLTPTSKRVVSSPPRKRRVVRATVKETGSDSIKTYIKSLGQHELLFKEDEVLLGRQVRMLGALEDKRQELEEELLRPPTFAQWALATNNTVPSLKQQIRRSQRAKAALIEANLRLVITVARQAVKKSPINTSQGANSIQFQDACQQGIIGLTRATEKYDPELGFRFSTYAIWWIQKEVAKNVSEQSRSVRIPGSAIKRINEIRIQERILMNELGRKPHDDEIAERVGMSVEKLNFYRQSAKEVGSLDKSIDARKGKGSMSTGGDSGGGDTMDVFVKDTEHPSPSELIDQQMLKEDIRRLVKTLSPREQAVIRLRFGLDDGKPLGLADISAKFGVDKARIKKIEAQALMKLRQPSRSHVVKCYVSDHT